MFECTCEACVQTSPDPRSSFRCRSRTCEALTAFEREPTRLSSLSHIPLSLPVCLSTVPGSKAASSKEDEDEDKPIVCQQCQAKLAPNTGEFLDALSVSLEALRKADTLQFSSAYTSRDVSSHSKNHPLTLLLFVCVYTTTDPMKALKYTTSCLALLQPYPLHLSSHPLLALTRLHLSLSLSSLASSMKEAAASLEDQRTRDSLVDDASRTAARCVAGVSGVPGMTEGHPVRGIALAELGKLLCVDVDPSPSPSPPSRSSARLLDNNESDQDDTNADADAALPRGVERLQLAAQVLKRARDELAIGFGKEGGGGDVGRLVDTMLRDLEREVSVWDKATRSAAR